jgi:hypothetical protein
MDTIYNTATKPVHAIASFEYKGYTINFSTLKSTKEHNKVVLLKNGQPITSLSSVEKAILFANARSIWIQDKKDLY